MQAKKIALSLVIGLPIVALAGLGGGISWLGSEAGNQYIADEVRTAAATALPFGQFELDALTTDVLTGVELQGIRISDADGVELFNLEKLKLSYNLYTLPQYAVDDIQIQLSQPKINIGVNDAGELRWNTLTEATETPPSTEPAEPFQGVGLAIELQQLALQNAQIYDGDTPVLTDLNIDLSGNVSRFGRIDLQLAQLNAGVPDLGDIALKSHVVLDGRELELLETKASLDELSLDLTGTLTSIYTNPETDLKIRTRLKTNALAPFANAPIPAIETPVEIDLQGPLSALNIKTSIDNAAGVLGVQALLDLESDPLNWDLTLSSDAFTVSDIVPNYIDQETRIAGHYRVHGSGTDWPSGVTGTIEFKASPQKLYGYDVEAIELTGALSEGQLTLTELFVKHDAAQVRLTGKADMIQEKADLAINVRLPDFAKLAEFGVADLKGVSEIDGPLKVKWGESVNAEYTGDLKFRSIQHPSANINDGIGQIGVKYDDSGLLYRGNIRLQDIDAAGTSIETAMTEFSGALSPENHLDLKADVAVNTIQVGDGAVQLNDINGGITFTSSEAGMTLNTEDLRLGTLELQPAGYVIDGGPLNLSLDGQDLKAEIILKRKDEDFVNVLAHGGLESGVWSLERFVFMPTDADPWSTKDVINLELKDDGVGAFAIDLEGNRGAIQLRNDILDGEPSLYLGIKKLDVAYLEEVATLLTGEAVLPPGAQGLISAELNLKGDDGQFGDNNHLRISDLHLPGLLEHVSLELLLSQGLSYPKVEFTLSDRLGRDLSRLNMMWPLDLDRGVSRCDDDMAIQFRIFPHPMSRFRESIPQLPESDGMISAFLDMDGTPCNPNLHLSSALAIPVGVYEKVVRIDSLVELDKNGLSLDASLSQDMREQLYIDGHIQSDMHRHLEPILAQFIPPDESDDPLLWFDEMDINVIFNELSIEDTVALVDAPKGLKGRIVGGVSIHGTPTKPIIEGGAAILNGRIGRTRISAANLAFESTEKHIALDGNMSIGSKGHATLSADIPKQEDGVLSFSSLGNEIPLDGALGILPGIENADGLLHWDLNLNTRDQSETHFLGGIEGGSLNYVPIGVRISELEFKVESSADQIILNYLRGVTLPLGRPDATKGTFNTSGIVTLETAALKEGTFHFKASDMWLHHTSLAKLALSGQSKIMFTPDSLNVDGDFSVNEGQVHLDERFFVQDATLALDPNMKIYRGGMSEPKAVVSEVEAESSYAVNANVGIDLNRKVRIKAAMPMLSSYGSSFAKLSTVHVDTTLDGRLNIAYSDDDVEIIGDVLTPKGSIDMLGSTFLIDNGAVHFVGTDYANPELDMKATKRMPKYGDINIELQGLVSNLQPVFSEESGQYDDTDVMSLILFGKPVSELTESEGDGGSALLSSALSSVTSSLGGAIGGNMVDEVELNPSEGSFRIGKSLSEKLYLVYQKNMQAQEGENFNEFSLEWLIQSRLYAEFIAGDAMVSSADIYYRWVF